MSLRDVQTALAGLGPVEEPADLPLRIRVAVSQERARSRRSIFTVLDLAWKNTVGPFLLQAGAGFASAVLLLGTIVVLVTVLRPAGIGLGHARRAAGQCHGAASALLLQCPGRQSADAGAINGPVVVEAFINRFGEVYDYRILSGPTDAAHALPGGEPAALQPLCAGPLLRPAGARIGGAVVLRRERARVKKL